MKDNSDNDSIFTNRSYSIWIEAIDKLESIKRQVSSQTPDSAFKFLFEIFYIIKNAALSDNIRSDSEKTESEKISDVLFERFNLDNVDQHGSVENVIINYIDDLKKFQFYVPKDLEEEPFVKRDIDWIVKHFEDSLRSLRVEKIVFWNALLKKYREDREGYNLIFRTKETRLQKDLDRAYKITAEDAKDLL